jgi:hypothetical protein
MVPSVPCSLARAQQALLKIWLFSQCAHFHRLAKAIVDILDAIGLSPGNVTAIVAFS